MSTILEALRKLQRDRDPTDAPDLRESLIMDSDFPSDRRLPWLAMLGVLSVVGLAIGAWIFLVPLIRSNEAEKPFAAAARPVPERPLPSDAPARRSPLAVRPSSRADAPRPAVKPSRVQRPQRAQAEPSKDLTASPVITLDQADGEPGLPPRRFFGEVSRAEDREEQDPLSYREAVRYAVVKPLPVAKPEASVRSRAGVTAAPETSPAHAGTAEEKARPGDGGRAAAAQKIPVRADAPAPAKAQSKAVAKPSAKALPVVKPLPVVEPPPVVKPPAPPQAQKAPPKKRAPPSAASKKPAKPAEESRGNPFMTAFEPLTTVEKLEPPGSSSASEPAKKKEGSKIRDPFPELVVRSVRWHPDPERRVATVLVDQFRSVEVHQGDLLQGATVHRIDPGAVELQIGSARKRLRIQP